LKAVSRGEVEPFKNGLSFRKVRFLAGQYGDFKFPIAVALDNFKIKKILKEDQHVLE
jgi:hypothetical protein